MEEKNQTVTDAFDPDDEAGIGQASGRKRYGLLMVEPGRWLHKSCRLIVREPESTNGQWWIAEEFADRLEIDRSIPATSLQAQARYLDDLLLGTREKAASMRDKDEALQAALAGIRRKIEAMKTETSRWDDLALEDYQGIRNRTIDEILEVIDGAKVR